MARPISDEELQLKKRARRRLVGAIVLVTAVAVILPMVLDSEPKSISQNVDIQIPQPDSGEFKPKGSRTSSGAVEKPIQGMPTAPAKAEPPTSVAKVDPTPPAVSPISEPPATKEVVKGPPAKAPAPVATEAPKAAAKETATAEAAPKEAPASASGAYVVQVAALSDTAKAKQLEKQMAGVGLQTYTEVVNTQAGAVTRVRAGPFATKEAAEKARTQLKKAGLDGKVVPK